MTDEETSISFSFAHATAEQTKLNCCFSCSNSPKTVLMKNTQKRNDPTAYRIINNNSSGNEDVHLACVVKETTSSV